MKKLLVVLKHTYLSKYKKLPYPKISWVNKNDEPVESMNDVPIEPLRDVLIEPDNGSIDTKISSFSDRITSRKTWLDGFNLTKENLGTALLLVSGLGAVIQIIELIKIDISYLRFFSVTQLAADGALAFVTVLYSFIIYRLYLITYTSMSIIPRLEKAIEDKDNKYVPSEIMSVIALFVGVQGAAIFLNVEAFGDRSILMFTINAMMLATLFFVSKYFLLVRKHIKVSDISKKGIWSANFLVVSSVSITIYALIKIAGIYIELYRIPTPNKLNNYEYLASRVKKDYGITDNNDYKPLYFNDKYTFVEIKSNKSVIIYKTDDVMYSVRHTIVLDEVARQENLPKSQ